MLGRCSAPSTWIRVVELVPAWVSWTNPLLSQLTPALLLYLSATGTIHLLLQHITSPTTATYPGRICPYGCQRQPSLCPPHQVRPHVVPTHWASSPCRPTYPPDTTPVSPSFRGVSFLQVIDGGATGEWVWGNFGNEAIGRREMGYKRFVVSAFSRGDDKPSSPNPCTFIPGRSRGRCTLSQMDVPDQPSHHHHHAPPPFLHFAAANPVATRQNQKQQD
ncbi:hypothetical protein TIFTF001_000992 [Ficus carica]|uniref:Uncharacterized protein n=1 Tax=Ficus carica TaxID=3494 RepID=A0AA88D3A1_FICCA|nr:hypothetical protein TIFTF001_000992 [Ficus carica]